MDITFENLTVNTVPSDYSWDKQVPNERTLVQSVLSGNKYTGYAPFVSVLLSSYVDNLSGAAIAFITTTDYGDYYNSETNSQTSLLSGNQIFCHNYLMPGTYTLMYKRSQYVSTDISRCSEGSYNPYDTYIEKEETKTERLPFSWMWYNFLRDDYDPRTEFVGSYEPRNEFLTWDDCVFQGSKQVTWEQASGPAIEIRQGPVSWQWKKIKTKPDPFELYTQNTNWVQTKPNSLFPRTWKQIKEYKCANDKTECLELVPTLSSTTYVHVLTSFLEVKEIPPTAFLNVVHSKALNERTSPYKVTLTPRYIRCGSFPIEKILWDLGDGTPVIEKTRANPNQTYDTVINFVHQNYFDSDFLDPRNFDLEYTYTRTPETGNCFYPSLTAFASSTGTIDCASAIVGPLTYQSHDNSKFRLIQNYLSEKGVAYTGAVESSFVFWNRNK
jgi:hypothetical protein